MLFTPSLYCSKYFEMVYFEEHDKNYKNNKNYMKIKKL